jgi:hypothetical protein
MRHFALIVFAGLMSGAVLLAPSTRARGQNEESNMAQRLNQLEAESQAMRAELERLRQQQPQRLPVTNRQESPAYDSGTAPAPSPRDYGDAPPMPTQAASASYAPDAQPGEDYFTLEELKGEMKKLVWKKGDFTVTPYGYLWGNMVYETERSNTGDYTLWVFSEQREGQPTFHADGKSTRLGIDVLGPKLPCLNATTGGKVEIDFQGSFITENKGSVLLRHAYLEVKNEYYRLLAGQTWDVISPLVPGTIMYSVYWDAGNIGYRRAQFRGERFMAFSDTMLLTMQGSLNGNVVTDTDALAVGDQSCWPILEGRAAITLGPRGKNDLPITVGVSSHVGEQNYRFAGPVIDHARTWSINADWKVPFNECTGIQGECFAGENLGSFLGGIGQGYNFVLREPIYSRGGWLELYHYWSPRWHSHFGYCVDDPNDNDITLAVGRIYNQAYFGNVVFDVTKLFQLGLELSSWKTLYKGELPGEDVRVEFMAKYGF